MPAIRTLTVKGDPYRRGYQHGRAYAGPIGELAEAFLAVNHGRITVEKLMEMTRIHTEEGFSICQSPIEGYEVETAGAVIMCPTTREMWALWGRPSENEYEKFMPGKELAEA